MARVKVLELLRPNENGKLQVGDLAAAQAYFLAPVPWDSVE